MTILESVSRYIYYKNDADEKTKRMGLQCFIDTFGCMLLGCKETSSLKVMNCVKRLSKGNQASVYGGVPFQTDIENAAFVNAVSAHNCDYDDMTSAGCGHPSVPVFPVVLSLGEAYHKSGAQILDAYITGLEVSMRLGCGFKEGRLDLAWNPTTICGIFGATAAAAKLLELNEKQICAALGMASCEAGGTKGNYGTEAKNVSVAHLCVKGIRCAELAKDGIGASSGAFEAENGFISCYAKLYDTKAALRAFGEKESFLKQPGIIQKPYPTCRSNHNAIDGAVRIHELSSTSVNSIISVECMVDEASMKLDTYKIPRNSEEAKFSTAYCVALGLLYGKVEVDRFLSGAQIDEKAKVLIEKIHVTEKKNFNPDSSFANELKVRFKNGSCMEYLGEYAKGDPRKPLSDEERYEKFIYCASAVCNEKNAKEIYSYLERMWECVDFNLIKESILEKLKGDI